MPNVPMPAVELDGLKSEAHEPDTALRCERLKTAYHATARSKAPEIGQPPVLAQC